MHPSIGDSRWLSRLACVLGCAVAIVSQAGCAAEHVQSALHPAGPGAESIARLWWGMSIVLTFVFVLVLALLLGAIFARRRAPERPTRRADGFILAGGVVLPTIVLVGFLFASLQTAADLRMPDSALRIQVIGHQWWWEVRYPEQGVVTANELYIPAGTPVHLELWAADVIHSFWVPNLHGKMDMLPERVNRTWIQADVPGAYRGQCAEYCGLQHAKMAFFVVALPGAEFEAWLERTSRSSIEPATDAARRGEAVFYRAACHNCHAIRDTAAKGTIGPDLTHVGSRLTLGAGVVPNTPGNLSGWIANPQPLKPGNRMPPSYLKPDELEDLRVYLDGLR